MIRELTCAICGAYAGRWKQHWNRDRGFGICASCAAEEFKKLGPEGMRFSYGDPGVNYGAAR